MHSHHDWNWKIRFSPAKEDASTVRTGYEGVVSLGTVCNYFNWLKAICKTTLIMDRGPELYSESQMFLLPFLDKQTGFHVNVFWIFVPELVWAGIIIDLESALLYISKQLSPCCRYESNKERCILKVNTRQFSDLHTDVWVVGWVQFIIQPGYFLSILQWQERL